MIKLKNNCKNLEKITFKTETIIWYHTGDQYESKFQERSLNRPLPKFPEIVQEKNLLSYYIILWRRTVAMV